MSARVDNLTICYCKKQIDVSFSYVCPVIDHECYQNIIIVAVDPPGDSDYLDNVMTKLIVNNRTDA